MSHILIKLTTTQDTCWLKATLMSPSHFFLLQRKTCSKTKFSILLWISSNSIFWGLSTPLFWIILLTLVSFKKMQTKQFFRSTLSHSFYCPTHLSFKNYISSEQIINCFHFLTPILFLVDTNRVFAPNKLTKNYHNKDNGDPTAAK